MEVFCRRNDNISNYVSREIVLQILTISNFIVCRVKYHGIQYLTKQ